MTASASYTSAYASLPASAVLAGLGVGRLGSRTAFEAFGGIVSTVCAGRRRSVADAAIGGLPSLRQES